MPLESLTGPSQGKRANWLLAIDPGCEESAWLLYNVVEQRPVDWAKEPNELVLRTMTGWPVAHCAIEVIQSSFGMPAGATMFQTAIWTGRFIQRWRDDRGAEPRGLHRKTIVNHICGVSSGADKHVRQALIDRYGPGREKAIGIKGNRGPLYGLTADCWSALAIAVTAAELRPSA